MSELRTRVLRGAVWAVLGSVARFVTGVRPIWSSAPNSDRQRIYFANHASHGDFILVSTCLPQRERARTRAVAAADYWGKSRLRRLIAEDMLSSVLIERQWTDPSHNPIAIMLSVLDRG